MSDDEINGQYEAETGKVIIETFKDCNINFKDVPAVLVHSHGPFAWGKSPANAVYNAVVLEEIAYMAFHTFVLMQGYLKRMQQTLLTAE